ncbi:MAG: sulfotransferase family protein, partial [Gammaproteobacteria bacterium]
ANAISPKHTPFMHNLANCLVHHGETDKAESLYRDIIEIWPDSSQAHWALATSKKSKDTSHIEEMGKYIAKNDNNPLAKSFYYYAMGKEHEDQQNWSEAFEAFQNGAKAKRSIEPFDEQLEIATFDYLAENFTESWLNDGAIGCRNDAPIFVLGQPRTGTTLIERIITSHSDVHSAGELQQFRLAIRRLGNTKSSKRFSPEMFDSAKMLDPEILGKMYMQTTGKMSGDSPRFVDKLPQNYLMLPLILKALPKAKVVHLVRDPMDACFASYKQLFADAYPHSYDQQEMARHHVRYLKLMQVWRDRFPGRFFDISYEETVRDVEPHARALIDYLGLPWQDDCLNFHQQNSAVSTASAVQVRQPAHTKSIGRWLKYEQQLQPMLETLQQHDIYQ